jgi:dynein light chain roadblock-type
VTKNIQIPDSNTSRPYENVKSKSKEDIFRDSESSLSPEDTENYAALVSQLAYKASGVVRVLDDTDELAFLRVRSKKHEIMIAPDRDYILVVIQNPHEG